MMMMRYWRLLRLWVALGLAVSLMLNLLLAGGFLYQRYWVIPRAHAVWAVEALHLDAAQQEQLLGLQAWARSALRDALLELKPDVAAARSVLREGQPDDAKFVAAMRRINDRRLQMQMQAAARIFAFRDTLTPAQRETFARLSEQPGFALRLLGIAARRQDPDE